MSKASAITVIKLDPPEEREDEWNEWYTNVHSPGRFECGFLGFRRFQLVPGEPPVDTRKDDQPRYLAIMELPDTSVLTSPEYDAITARWTALPSDSFEHLTMALPKFARGVLKLTGEYPTADLPLLPETRFIFMSAHEVPVEIADEFDEWSVEEHMPLVLGEPGYVSLRRYRHKIEDFPPMLSRGGELFTHLSSWDIESPDAFRNPNFAGDDVTPWQKRMRRMCTLKMSNVYREISRGTPAAA